MSSRRNKTVGMVILGFQLLGCGSMTFKAPPNLESGGEPYSVPWAEDGVSKFGPYVLQILRFEGTQLELSKRNERTFKGTYDVSVSSIDGTSTELHCQLKKSEVTCTTADSDWVVDFYGGTEEGKVVNRHPSSPEIRPIYYGIRGDKLGGYSIHHEGVALAAVENASLATSFRMNIWIAENAPNKTWLVATALIMSSFNGKVYERCESWEYDCGYEDDDQE